MREEKRESRRAEPPHRDARAAIHRACFGSRRSSLRHQYSALWTGRCVPLHFAARSMLYRAFFLMSCSPIVLPHSTQMVWLHPPAPFMPLWDDELVLESDTSNAHLRWQSAHPPIVCDGMEVSGLRGTNHFLLRRCQANSHSDCRETLVRAVKGPLLPREQQQVGRRAEQRPTCHIVFRFYQLTERREHARATF